ncbi:MAG: ankyrin repeat domain-containing protein, partial [Bacteroidota bacterium]
AGEKLKNLLKSIKDETDNTSLKDKIVLLNGAISTAKEEGIVLCFIQEAKDRGWNLDTQTPKGTTPLRVAISRNSSNTIKALAAAGVSLENKEDTLEEMTPMGFAIEREDFPLIKALAEAGADVNKAGRRRKTAMDLALQDENLRTVEVLVQAGAYINKVGPNGKTPMSLAANKDDEPLIRTLVSRGVQVDQADHIGMTPLHFAAQANSARAVTVLLELGADPALKTRVRFGFIGGGLPINWLNGIEIKMP